ncbi:MAG: tRNA adenosine(34) deaminase TadA [Clostridiales bacterium]|nr:tRNA adenosine(34) deaminase TadA [Clostridiales bacterium]
MRDDIFFMKEAIKRAKKAEARAEVPVGAVIVRDGKIISSGYNRREEKQNSLLHAEISAIDRACKKLGSWRLCGCTLYVTLEPCPMCAGAVINSRIDRVVFGAFDKRFGAMGSVCELHKMPFNHFPEAVGGVCEEECLSLLREFFKKLRNKKDKESG